ncbi:DUF547 domain-containing protein [Persephonella atlantica]|uniref:DUF547 domain-containing protein n=1 Tax=Persephonella atlantica TaxID=2699429 RepID=A0ABS1GK21_9AQUI|nr:DUF547 domain-containing protein [Persephonella atlantica]MBK3333230.1 DUF547 domain-containing protein [Persephonella atlantica]
MPVYEYLKTAKSILDKNHNGRFTVPSIHLYPHQWNWDSGFIAIGYSRYDTDRAIQEMVSLFEAQWENGMLPHIVFNPDNLGRYFPEPDFWQTDITPFSNKKHLTSGITQPPVHAYAALKIYENAKDKEKAKQFLRWIYPKLIKLHRYFYLERNPDDNGLIYIRHPWESGMDNSPMWDPVLERIDLSQIKLPPFKRKDNRIIDPEQRPKDEDYQRYIYLVELFKKHRYDERKIFHDCPFIVFDPLFNSVLSVSNEALIKIADIIGEDCRQAEEWYLTTARSMRDILYSKKGKIFYAYDYIEKKQIEVATSAGFMPLFGGVASHSQAVELFEYMDSTSFCKLHEESCLAIPNYDRTREDFSTKNYWRGPVWININWMLYQGLKRYKFKQKAEHLEKTILELPIRFGFYEYFDSVSGAGYGTKDFSWTAALFIDLLYEFAEKEAVRNGMGIYIQSVKNETVLNLDRNRISVYESDEIFREFNYLTDSIIKKYVRNGTVDYKSIKLSPEYKLFQNIAGKLAGFDYPFDRCEEKVSFWINLYNMMVVDFVIKMKLKRSVREVDGFFTKLKYRINGRTFSLKDIESMLTCEDKKEKIVLSLVKGAQSSPPLRYVPPSNIDKTLDKVLKDFINSSEVLILPEKNTVYLSEAFRWYRDIFCEDRNILNFVKIYTVDSRKREFLENRKPKITYIPYDWYLNN